MQLRLPARQPFSLGNLIRSHGWARLAPFQAEGEVLSYILQLGAGNVIELSMQAAPGGVAVDIAERLDEPQSAQVARAVTRMLGLHLDLSPFYALARSEPKLAHVEERGLGRLLCSPSVWEDAVKTILTTNVSWGNTVRMVERLVDSFGEPLSENASRKAFPSPSRIALSNVDTLRDIARLGYRAPYVHALARSVSSGGLDLEGLMNPDLSTEQIRRELFQINGVGAYAAASILMLLGRYEHIPVDSWGLRLTSHEWYQDQPVTRAQVAAAFERWGRWKGLAYWFWNWSDPSDA